MKYTPAAFLFFGVSIFTALGQAPTEDDARNKATQMLLEMERSKVQASGSAELARHMDLGEKVVLMVEDAIPKSLARYESLLRGPDGLLKNEAGKFLSQNPDVVETLVRFVLDERFPIEIKGPEQKEPTRTDFGKRESDQRLQQVRQSMEALQKFGDGSRFDPATSPAALAISENAAWAARQFEKIENRNTFILGHLAAVPKGIDVSKLPTMEEELLATLSRRIFTQEKLLNDIEKKAEDEKAARVAEVAKGIREEQLESYIQNLKKLAAEDAKLAAAMAAKEREEVEIKMKEQLAANQAEYNSRMEKLEQERVDAEKKNAELRLLLAQKESQVKLVDGQAKVTNQLRALPQNAKVLVKILSAPGFYKAVGDLGHRLKAVPRYDGMEPVPHSLSALAASGALEDTPEGIIFMHWLLTTASDTERPRAKRVFKLRFNKYNIEAHRDPGTVISANDECKETTKKIRELQALIRDYGEELVAAKLLAP